MGRTRMTAAAKRLKLTHTSTLTYHSTGFFSLAQKQHSVSCRRAAGAAAGAASASDAPPMRGCVLARTPIGRRDESRATSRRSNSSHIPIAATCRSLLARRRHHHRHSLPPCRFAGAAGPPGGGGQVLGGLEAPATAVIWAPIRRRLSHSDLSALGGRARCDRASEPLEASRCSIGIGVGRPHR